MSRRPDFADGDDKPMIRSRARPTESVSSESLGKGVMDRIHRREERKRTKFEQDGIQQSAKDTVDTTSYSSDTMPTTLDSASALARNLPEESEEPEDEHNDTHFAAPGAFHVGREVGGGVGTRFDDLSTLSPRTHTQMLPVAAELAPDTLHNGGGSSQNPNVQEIVSEVLRQQGRAFVNTINADEEEGYSQAIGPTPPASKPPVIAEAVAVKTICGMQRCKFLLCVFVLLLLAGLGIALGMIFGGGKNGANSSEIAGGSDGGDVTSGPTPAPAPTVLDLGNGLTLQEELIGRQNRARFGSYIEFSGDGSTIAIGGPGKTYVQILRWDGAMWAKIGTISQTNADSFGTKLDLNQDGSRLVVGSPFQDENGKNAGIVEVFQYEGGTSWSPRGSPILGINGNDFFGWDVAMSSDGERILATARLGNNPNMQGAETGLAQVYEYDPWRSDWKPLGSRLYGEENGDGFGRSCGMSADGRTIIIGANEALGRKGRVYVYQYANGDWSLLGQKLDGKEVEDFHGTSCDISADGSIIAIGADGHDSGQFGTNSGVIKIYQLSSSMEWEPYGSFVHGTSASEILGSGQVSLSSDGQTLAAGALSHNDNRGIAYLYRYIQGEWRLIDSDKGELVGDRLGFSVAVSGDGTWYAAGAPDDKGDRPGYARIYSI